LYFTADNGTNGNELWKTNGTEASTTLVKDIWVGSVGSLPSFLTNVSGTLYFAANNGIAGQELWKTNGTEAGTTMVKDIFAGSSGSIPLFITTTTNNNVFFHADNGVNGCELWLSKGTATSTNLVYDIFIGNNGSDPRWLTKVNNGLYFRGIDTVEGDGIWKSDGTNVGTVQLKNGAGTHYELCDVAGTIFYVADRPDTGFELWKSDGSITGGVQVKDINAGAVGSMPNGLTAIGNVLYFVANDGSTGSELWRSDGTAAGTVRIRDIKTGAEGSNPHCLMVWNGILYFVADDGSGAELWKTNGTEAGTVRVKDIWAGSSGSEPTAFMTMGSSLYFAADNGSNGRELWKTDGTEAGTVLVKDIYVGSLGSIPHSLVNMNDILFFTADDGVSGCEVWRSDGTSAGTVRLKDVKSGAASSLPTALTVVDKTLYFTAETERSGVELWKSNGTEAGTVLLKNINTNLDMGGNPQQLINVNGLLYFVADDGKTGTELWRTDGREAGTVLVKDIFQNERSSNPRQLLNINGTLYFVADDGMKGNEIWRLDPCPILAKVSQKTLTVCARSTATIEGKASACAGAVYSWSSKPAGVSGDDLKLIFSAPDVAETTVYTLYFTVKYGSESSTDSTKVNVTPQTKLNITVLLEGAYDKSTQKMSTVLNQSKLLPGQFPTDTWAAITAVGQPYKNAPWNYNGTESLYDYTPDVVDWVLFSLRTNADDVASTILKSAVLLKENGQITQAVGCLNVPSDKPYYIGIDHRNHLGVLSHQAVSVSNQTLSYDFTKQQSYIPAAIPAFGQKKIGSTFFMYAGDFSKIGTQQIDAQDMTIFRRQNGKFLQYLQADANLDGEVNALDRIYWTKNNGIFSAVSF
jgi:ELWxxDGT repeat protein